MAMAMDMVQARLGVIVAAQLLQAVAIVMM
jgi:hypothetical protein